MLTQDQKHIIENMYANHAANDIAAAAGVKVSQVYTYAAKCGLKKSDAYYQNGGGGRLKKGSVKPGVVAWTEQEKKELIRLYPDHTAKEIAAVTGRAISSVYRMAALMGLQKSEAFMQSEKSGRLMNGERGKSTRFVKGQASWSKGKKLGPSNSKTKFSKGNVPHNTKYDGHERVNVEGYVEVRVVLGKYVPKHRLVWQEAHGPVPAGMVVVFRDGNKLNTDISNLELIHRKDLISRNTIHRYPEELKSVIRLVGKVKRIIKNHEKQD